MILATSCSKSYIDLKIPFVATWGGDIIQCTDSEIALSDLRFYVSSIELVDAGGEAQALELHADIPWQQPDLALIDLENGQGACMNGTGDTFAYLVGSVPTGDYRGLRFTVGVPFDRNHSNPLTARAPLDDPAMHWHWRSGYKFIRAGVETPNDGFWIHVGSAGCEGTVRNISACRFPNRVTVELSEYVPNIDTISVDLKSFFESIDIDDGESTSCSSGPAESACVAPFAALGIDFESGTRLSRQQVFSIRR